MTQPTDIRQAFRDRVRSRLDKAETVATGRGYDIKNADGDVAEIRIYEEIHWLFGIDAEQFARELALITAPEILVMINSPGGDVFDGIAIYNALRAHPAKVTTRVDGVAASIASVIAQAGDHRIMLTGSQMMIHEAWGLAIGNAEEMRAYADLLDRQNDNIAAIYARRADKTEEHFRAQMKSDKWFNADETVAEGLADEVVDLPPNEATAKAAPAPRTTLQDELTETVAAVEKTLESAERVAALRAEKSKELSQVNQATLNELAAHMERLQALLDQQDGAAPAAASSSDESGENLTDAVRHEFLKFASTS